MTLRCVDTHVLVSGEQREVNIFARCHTDIIHPGGNCRAHPHLLYHDVPLLIPACYCRAAEERCG
jgi:hypothetical protein